MLIANPIFALFETASSGVRLALNEKPRVSLALHPGLISCQPSGLASCTPEACEDGSPGCASDSEPPRVGDHTKTAPREGCEEWSAPVVSFGQSAVLD